MEVPPFGQVGGSNQFSVCQWLLDEYGINDMKLSLAEAPKELEEAIKDDDQFLSKASELLKDSKIRELH
jgi:SUMO ligase MMS21 Smc5/6 complex component